ncbi:MAG TPA: hypothetical protein VFC78_12470 [Tepidisphaeraceae bacterium]|nr:hypothetical protein [Tepidisphaeraceae bacterium]
MRHIQGIVVVNEPDLLQRAVDSVEPLWENAFILDNSPGGWIGRDRRWPVPVVRPSVPLSVAQSLNFLQRLAREAGADVFFFQHNDAEAQPGSAMRFLQTVQEHFDAASRWATVFTHYDILSAYHVAAVNDIGDWDTAFPQPNYHIDNDWFHRARLKGYELTETGIAVTHHNGASSTLRGSDLRRRVNDVTFPMNEEYYRRKWGGPPGGEVYASAWNCNFDLERE